jgi:hypothetical protein
MVFKFINSKNKRRFGQMLQILKLFVAFVFQTTFNRQTKWIDKSPAGNNRIGMADVPFIDPFFKEKNRLPGKRPPIHPFPIGLILQNCNNFGYYK